MEADSNIGKSLFLCYAFISISFPRAFLLNIIDSAIDATDSTMAVRNIKSKEDDEGKDSVTPLTLIVD
jgi:hypothetical protein